MMRCCILVFVAFLLSSTAQAQLSCSQLWEEDGDFWSELLPAPLDDELTAPSSEDAILHNSQEDVQAFQLETFGSLLTQHDSSMPATFLNQSLQRRNWQIFQTLYGIQVARDARGQWNFVFHAPHTPHAVAQQFGLSESRLETMIRDMHFVRILRLRAFPNYWEAYRQIVDRQLPFGKTLEDYIELLKNREARNVRHWQSRGGRY